MTENKHLCMQCMLETDSRDTVCPYCGYPSSSKQPESFLPHGSVISERYLIGKMIKRNVDSAVYIGKDNLTGRTVEIREFFPEKISLRGEDEREVLFADGYENLCGEYLHSFIQLWRNLMRFKGLPALFEVGDVFEENKTAYAVTDHNESTTFGKILDTMDIENNPFSLSRTQALIMSILSTVESLHTAGVVHRGISPETLVLTSAGTLKITGFAIAQVRTKKNKIISSVCDGYAAIEQYDFNWQQGSWTDIYSIGALIYKLLTGRTLSPAPSRLNGEEVFFTDEDVKRIPAEVIALIKECLVIMPQGRIKDVHDIINVFSKKEASKKTVTAFRNRAVQYEAKSENKKEQTAFKQASALPQADTKREETDLKPLVIVKPKQAQAKTKTSLAKSTTNYDEQRIKERQKNEEERKIREELYIKQQQAQEKARIEDEKRRKQREEELRRKNKEKRRLKMEKSAAGRAVKKVNEKADVLGDRIKKRVKNINPVKLAVSVGILVTLTCVFLTFLLYGTVLYRFVDAPVLDNCLSSIAFLPVNAQDDGENAVDYVEVPDFKTLTREYIENDALYNKRYRIVFEYDYCDTVEKGYVFSQSIESDKKVPLGTQITVYISKGVQMIKFIKVSGMQYDEAYGILTSLGFTVEKQEVYNIGIYTQDKVISANLDDGENYPKGTCVTLKVWAAPPVTLPPVSETEQPTQGENNEGEGSEPERRRREFFSFFDDIFDF